MHEVEARRRRGDYFTRLEVDPTKPAQNDSIHFRRLTDALDAARGSRGFWEETATARCPITIVVARGILRGSFAESSDPTLERFPFLIDVPDITIRGALRIQPTGAAAMMPTATDSTTRIEPSPPLAVVGAVGNQPGLSQPIFVVNGASDGTGGGYRAVIEGFSMTSGHAEGDATLGGQGILALRVHGLIVRGNQFAGNFTERIDLRASEGVVEWNVSSGIGNSCDFCLAGPGTYTATRNRLVGGGIPGIYVSPTVLLPVPDGIEQYTLPAVSNVFATVTRNVVTDHQRRPVGTGLRLSAIGVGAPNVRGKVIAELSYNTLVGNMFGIIVEAGFPVAGAALRGDVTAVLEGNAIAESCQAPLLVSFSRHTTGLGLATAPYLQNSTIALTTDELADFDRTAWYAHTPNRGNTLVLNGGTVAPGHRASYDATGCPTFGSARIAEAVLHAPARR